MNRILRSVTYLVPLALGALVALGSTPAAQDYLEFKGKDPKVIGEIDRKICGGPELRTRD